MFLSVFIVFYGFEFAASINNEKKNGIVLWSFVHIYKRV